MFRHLAANNAITYWRSEFSAVQVTCINRYRKLKDIVRCFQSIRVGRSGKTRYGISREFT